MKDKPIRSILDQSFNYALQDIVEPNAVSMIPKQHLDQAEQAIKDLIDQEVKKAVISELKDLQSQRISIECSCCIAWFDKIAFKVAELEKDNK